MSDLSSCRSKRVMTRLNAEKALMRIEQELNQLIFRSPGLDENLVEVTGLRLKAFDLKNDMAGAIRKLYEKGEEK